MWPPRTSFGAAPTGPRHRECAGPRRVTPCVDARPRPSPHAADPLHTIRPPGGDRLGVTSSRRPPPGQRDADLQVVHLRVKPLGLHEHARQPWRVAAGAPHPGHPARSQELVTPLRGPRRRDPPIPATPTRDLRPAAGGVPSRVYAGPKTAPSGHARWPLRAPAGRPPPLSIPQLFRISTLLLRELSRNQVSKKTLGRRTTVPAWRSWRPSRSRRRPNFHSARIVQRSFSAYSSSPQSSPDSLRRCRAIVSRT